MFSDTVFLSILKRERERDFAKVWDRPTSLAVYRSLKFLTVSDRFMTVSELFWS